MPVTATFRFYEELNDFLPDSKRKVEFPHRFTRAGSVKDAIEALGVPHTEVDLILVNGESVDFAYQVKDGDRVSVYPVFESIEMSPLVHLRPSPLRNPTFVLDTHLGRLAAYLRMFGFDSLYRNDYDDPELAQISSEQHRILLTRDRKLLMRKQVTRGYYVRERLPRMQLLEVLHRFDLFTSQQPFTRCMHCNGKIRKIDKRFIENRLQPRTRAYYSEFWQCGECGNLYWKGSHYQRMERLISSMNHEESGARSKKSTSPRGKK
ncbi:MAG: Mut7-C RNAse domain-containing protein [Acidiferrobacterales bacterium]|nr:Mut7-C RNAse domain-containing protein [Acidiferrobacterales bacterium]